MGLKDHKVKSEYRSLIDNVVQDFYIPLLKDAVSYKEQLDFSHRHHLSKYQKVLLEWQRKAERFK